MHHYEQLVYEIFNKCGSQSNYFTIILFCLKCWKKKRRKTCNCWMQSYRIGLFETCIISRMNTHCTSLKFEIWYKYKRKKAAKYLILFKKYNQIFNVPTGFNSTLGEIHTIKLFIHPFTILCFLVSSKRYLF